MAKIALEAESALADYGYLQQIEPDARGRVTDAVAHAASTVASRTGAAAILTLTDELATGQVDAIFFKGVNPLYDLPFGPGIAASMSNILSISFAQDLDETAAGDVLANPIATPQRRTASGSNSGV